MADSSITIHLDVAVQERLAAIAEARQQPLSAVAADVLAGYVDAYSWESQHIRAGMAELEAGKGISHERVLEWLDSWGTEHELPAPR